MTRSLTGAYSSATIATVSVTVADCATATSITTNSNTTDDVTASSISGDQPGLQALYGRAAHGPNLAL